MGEVIRVPALSRQSTAAAGSFSDKRVSDKGAGWVQRSSFPALSRGVHLGGGCLRRTQREEGAAGSPPVPRDFFTVRLPFGLGRGAAARPRGSLRA